MAKRKHATSIDETATDMVFQRLADLINENPAYADRGRFTTLLGQLKRQMLGEGECDFKKPAGDFTFQEVIETFELKYSDVVSIVSTSKFFWPIEDSLQSTFPMTPCLSSLVENYSRNFDRSSSAVCRTALDFMLNECLTVMKNNYVEPGTPQTNDRQSKTPTPCDDIQVHGEVSFNHRIPTISTHAATVVSGRLDYGIGRILRRTARDAQKQRPFQSLLIIVEAKSQRAVNEAIPQLLVYLACLRQSRIRRHRTDASVYGVASDGYLFLFVMITHDGIVKLSRCFDVAAGDTLKVLGCLRYILETTVEMSPNVTPEKSGGNEKDVSDCADHEIDLDDNEYTLSPQDDEDDDASNLP